MRREKYRSSGEHLKRLARRKDYLSTRIKNGQGDQRDQILDISEFKALSWAIALLERVIAERDQLLRDLDELEERHPREDSK